MFRLLAIVLVFGSGWNVEVDAFLPRFPVNVANKFGLNTIHDPETDRIVGGEEASIDEFPFQASIQRIKSNGGSSHFCGGSIIAPDCIVTAAHCCSSPASKMRVYVGSHRLQSNGSYINVKAVKRHEDYSPETISNDIGVLKLESPIVFNDKVQPISLHDHSNLADGTECTCSGWGTTSEGGSIPNQLRKVSVPLISNSECEKYYGADEITESMICAGLAEGGKDSCQGDSGGPLITSKQLVGVVSWGYGCARPNYPGVYTNVAKFKAWALAACSNQ